MRIGKVGRRVVEAAFDGGDIVSDGGAPLLQMVDERVGLTRAAARVFADGRRAASVRHNVFRGQDVLACVLRPSWRDPASILRGSVPEMSNPLASMRWRMRLVSASPRW